MRVLDYDTGEDVATQYPGICVRVSRNVPDSDARAVHPESMTMVVIVCAPNPNTPPLLIEEPPQKEPDWPAYTGVRPTSAKPNDGFKIKDSRQADDETIPMIKRAGRDWDKSGTTIKALHAKRWR